MIVSNQSVSELSNALEGSSCELSFWGGRVVSLASGERVSLHELSHRLFILGFDSLEKNYGIEDRVHGHQLRQKLVQFYDDTDLELSKANPLTRLIFAIRSFLGLIDEGHHPSPEADVSALKNDERMLTLELFQGFQSRSDYWNLCLSRPYNFLFDKAVCTNEIEQDGTTKVIHYYVLKEIGDFSLF